MSLTPQRPYLPLGVLALPCDRHRRSSRRRRWCRWGRDDAARRGGRLRRRGRSTQRTNAPACRETVCSRPARPLVGLLPVDFELLRWFDCAAQAPRAIPRGGHRHLAVVALSTALHGRFARVPIHGGRRELGSGEKHRGSSVNFSDAFQPWQSEEIECRVLGVHVAAASRGGWMARRRSTRTTRACWACASGAGWRTGSSDSTTSCRTSSGSGLRCASPRRGASHIQTPTCAPPRRRILESYEPANKFVQQFRSPVLDHFIRSAQPCQSCQGGRVVGYMQTHRNW